MVEVAGLDLPLAKEFLETTDVLRTEDILRLPPGRVFNLGGRVLIGGNIVDLTRAIPGLLLLKSMLLEIEIFEEETVEFLLRHVKPKTEQVEEEVEEVEEEVKEELKEDVEEVTEERSQRETRGTQRGCRGSRRRSHRR